MSASTSLKVHGPDDPVGTVLLLHGFGASGLEHFPIDGIPARLASVGIRSVIPDLLGHGASRDRRAVITVADQLAAIETALDEASIVPTGLVGYSLGARLAWELLDDPRFGRVVLGGLPPFEPFARVDSELLASAVAGSTTVDGPLAGLASLVRGAGARGSELMAVIRGLAADPFAAEPPSAPGAVLLIAGADDPMAAPEELAARIAGSSALRIPGDHAGVPASPAFAEAVVAHLVAG